MAKNSFISSFKRLPLAFLGSVVLFCLTHGMIVRSQSFWRFCYLYGMPQHDDAIRVEAQLKLIPDTDTTKKVFLIGASQAREDYDVAYLNDHFPQPGVAFFNFGISGNEQPFEMFMMLEEMINKKPRAIIYTSYVGSFYSDYIFSKMKHYFSPEIMPYFKKYLTPKEIWAQKDYFIDSYLGLGSLLYRYREQLKRILKLSLNERIRGKKRESPEYFGYTENKPLTYFTDSITQSDNRYYTTPFTGLNHELFTQFAENIVSRGIAFIVIDGPTHPLIEQCYRREIDDKYHAFYVEKSQKIGFTYLTGSQLPSFSAEQFIDFTHLNAGGRKIMTQFLHNYLVEKDL